MRFYPASIILVSPPAGILILGLALTLTTDGSPGAEVEVGEVVYVGSTAAESATLNMEVGSDPLARILVEYTPNFVEDWQARTPPVTAADTSTPISIPLADLPDQGFFRIVVQPPRVSVRREAGLITVQVSEEGVTPEEILIGLFRLLGEAPNLSLPYDPADEETSPHGVLAPVGKGVYRGADLPQLGRQLGWRIWGSTPGSDDPALADAHVPLDTERGQPHEVPGDGGRGQIENGWEGDEIRAVPGRLTTDPPEPGSFDMPFRPDVPDGFDEPKGDREPLTGKHVRLRLRYDGTTFTIEKVVAQDTGSGLLSAPLPLPGEDSFIIAVKDAAGRIYHLFPFEDPRIARSYNPPQGGSHGHEVAADGSVRVTLPIIGDDVLKGLEGIQFSILKMAGFYPGDGTLLTADVINRNPALFPEVHRTPGEAIATLLRGGAPSPARRGLRSATKAATISTLHKSGGNGAKFNVAIMGDGFRDTAADQDAFNAFVQDTVMTTLQNKDIHPSILNGMNIFRINTHSEQSGITTVNGSGAVVTPRSTALEYRFSGIWNRCWMEAGPNSQALIDAVLDDVCPQADFVVLVLNTTSFGGCATGSRFTVTLGGDWSVVAHEFGHRPGTLGDEYSCAGSCGCYMGPEPGKPNLTRNTSRASLKWNVWIPGWRPLPTVSAQIAVHSQDVGLFSGGTLGTTQWSTCLYHPSLEGRMNNNSPPHNPPGYTNVRERFRPYQDADFQKNVVGDFNGDGLLDTVLQDGRQLSLYVAAERNAGPDDPVTNHPPRAVTAVLVPYWYRTDRIPNSSGTRLWRARAEDILLPGDFNGDGLDDLYIINHSSWDVPYVVFMKSYGSSFEPVGGYGGDLPGWQRRSGDKFHVADFDKDGRDDLIVFNGTDWSVPYLGMLRSTGSGLQMAKRYDQYLPNWEMGRHEQIHIGDFNHDGRQDVLLFNRQSWGQVHLLVYTSTGTGLSLADRHYGTIPSFWQMRRKDNLHVLDFNGDGNSDVALFNGLDWGPSYLGYLASDNGSLHGTRRYDNADSPLFGWPLQRRDRFHVGDIDGDGDHDLIVYNKDNWNTEFLGIVRSFQNATSGFFATGSWQSNWIDGWNLDASVQFKVGNFRGGARWDDLFVFNEGWFGLLRGYKTHFRVETIYRKWIFNHRYHSSGWW